MKKIIQITFILSAILPALVQVAKAQDSSEYDFSTNSDGSIGINFFYGEDVNVSIPSTVTGMPVTTIATGAFGNDVNLYAVMIPSSVTNIGPGAFAGLLSLTEIMVDPSNPLYSTFYSGGFGALCDKGQTALIQCPGDVYDAYTLPGSITSIAAQAFDGCSSLPSVLIPASVTNIGDYAFDGCSSLTCAYFQGNAPAADLSVFGEEDTLDPVTAYYLPGTTGWCDFSTNTGVPVMLWNPLIQTGDGSFGVQTNQFGFNITGTNNFTVVVEACTDLSNPVWVPIQTATLNNGSFYFSDPQWTNYPGRFYGLSMP